MRQNKRLTRESWVSKRYAGLNVFEGKCPECGEKNDKIIGNFNWSMRYCENPVCNVTRFSDVGYYKIDRNGNREIIETSMNKRSS